MQLSDCKLSRFLREWFLAESLQGCSRMNSVGYSRFPGRRSESYTFSIARTIKCRKQLCKWCHRLLVKQVRYVLSGWNLTTGVIPMFNNITRYLTLLRPERGWVDSAEIGTRLCAIYGVLNLFASFFHSVSLFLFLPRSLPVLQLPLHWEAAIAGDRDAGRRLAPVQASLLAAMPDVYHSAFPTSRSPLQRNELLTEA